MVMAGSAGAWAYVDDDAQVMGRGCGCMVMAGSVGAGAADH